MSTNKCPFCSNALLDVPKPWTDGDQQWCPKCGASAEYKVLVERMSPTTRMTGTQYMWYWKNPKPCAHPAPRSEAGPAFIPGLKQKNRAKKKPTFPKE